jgi:hypothetical protein
MKLPACELAEVPRAKIVAYLLSATHPSGRSKAGFFQRFGFTAGEWQVLADALRRHAADHGVGTIEDSPFGKRYTIEGAIASPDGRNPVIRTVWFIERGTSAPRFVTAYPRPRSRT